MSVENVKKYKQKFRVSWFENELFRDWLAADECPDSAYCKACKCSLKAKLSLLTSHRKSKKHIKYMAMYQNSLEYHQVVPAKYNNIEEDDHCSSPLRRLSDSDNDNCTSDIERNTDSENDVKYSSQNHTSEGSLKIKREYQSFDTYPTSVYRGKYPNKYRKSYSGYRKLSDDRIIDEDPIEREVVAFGRSIAAQMRNLSEEKIAILSAEIQSLVTRARVEYLEEKKAQNSQSSSSVISISCNNADRHYE